MSTQLGEAFVPIRATLDKLDKDLAQARGKMDGALAKIAVTVKKSMEGVGKVALASVAGGLAAVGAAAAGAIAVFKNAIPAASDLNEALNASSVVFGDAAGVIQDFGRVASETAGLSAREFNQMAAETGAMLLNFGYSADQAAQDTVDLTQRAADMASIFNTDVGDALSAVQSGLQGQSLPLRRFGVDMSDSAIKAKALEMGLGDITRQSDSAGYAQASLALLMEQTDRIAGDFVNTSGDLANATRVQQARWENFMASLGSFALPVVGKLQGVFMDIAERVMPVVLEKVEPFADVALKIAEAFSWFIDDLMNGFDPLDSVRELIGNLSRAFGLSEEAIGGVIGSFDQVVEKIQGFISQAQQVLAPVIEAIGQFVSWKDILIALGIAIGLVVTTALAPMILAAAQMILVFSAVTATIALVRNAWENNWGGIQEKSAAVVDWLTANVPTAIEAIKDFIGETLDKIKAWWDANGADIMTKVTTTYNTVRDFISTAITAVSEFISETLAKIKAWWEANGDDVIDKAKTTYITIRDFISNVITAVSEFISTVLDKIRSWWAEHGDNVITIVKWWLEGVKNAINTVLTIIQGIVGYVLGVVQGLWSIFGESLLENARLSWDFIKDTFERALEFIGEIVDTVAAAIRGDWDAFGEHLQNAAGLAWEQIQAIFGTALEQVSNIVDAALTEISEWFETKLEAISESVQPVVDVWNDFADAVKGFWDWLKDKVFNFSINLPNLPSWAIPDSPLPIHTAWKDFADEMSRMTIRPQFDLEGIPGLALGLALDGEGEARQVNYYNTSTTTIHTNRDPMRVLRASRHLDKLSSLT